MIDNYGFIKNEHAPFEAKQLFLRHTCHALQLVLIVEV